MKSPRNSNSKLNLDEEFAVKSLNLMVSFYENNCNDEYQPIVTKNNATHKSSGTPNGKKEKVVPFSSPVLEYRLRRSFERKLQEYQDEVIGILEKTNELNSLASTNNINLNDIFAPDKAIRSDTPRYIHYREMDTKSVERTRRRHREPFDHVAVERQFRQKLKVAEEKGRERSRRRREILERNNKAVSQTPKKYETQKQKSYQKKVEEAYILKERRIHYEPEGGYRSYLGRGSPYAKTLRY